MASPRWVGLLRSLGRNLLILGICFALLEVGTRAVVPPREWPPRVIRQVDPENRAAFLPGAESFYESDEFRFTVRTNRYGRRDVEWSAEAMADPRNIVFIGDSMVFGYGVDREGAVPALLEARLARTGEPREVLDFSMVACSLPTYAELLEEALRLGVAAETVLLGITVGNDFSSDVLDPPGPPLSEAPPLPWYSHSAFLDYLKRRAEGSPVLVGSALVIGRWLGLTLYDTSGSYIFLRRQTPEQEAVFRRILAITGSIAAKARENGRRLHVVIFPNKIQVENTDELTGAIYDAEKPNRLIREQCEALGLACLDLRPVLSAAYRAGSGPLFFPVDRHHNEKGNGIVAEAIFEFLEATAREDAAAAGNSVPRPGAGDGNPGAP